MSPLYVDAPGIALLYVLLKRDHARLRKEMSTARSMLQLLADHLGVRFESGIHVEEKTPPKGSPAMRNASLLFVGLVLAAAAATAGCTSWFARDPGSDTGTAALDGAGKGAAIGAPLGPWGELVGGSVGAIVGALSTYHIAHRRGEKRASARLDPPAIEKPL